jgi:hypothetical protein
MKRSALTGRQVLSIAQRAIAKRGRNVSPEDALAMAGSIRSQYDPKRRTLRARRKR